MHKHRSSLLFSALAASFALSLSPASAQTASGSDAQANANRPSANAAYKSDRKAADNADEAWQRTHRASKIIGTEVRNAEGKKIGTVKDLVIDDPQSGRISQVVIAVGGVLGVGDKLFVVPYGELKADAGEKHLVLSGTNDLAQAFDGKHWQDIASRNAAAKATSTVGTYPSPASSAAASGGSASSAASTPSATPSTPSAEPTPSATPSASSVAPAPAAADSTAPSSSSASPAAAHDASNSSETSSPANYPSRSQSAAATSQPAGTSGSSQ
jgi:sporulation protein YlmC with PRC-barrel domain